jgi:putative hydrolase
MIDLHTHTLLSDGELLPSELVRRALVKGYTAIALTDHVDSSNIDFVLPRIVTVSKVLNKEWDIFVMPGVEITHSPLKEIPVLVKYARENGAKIVVVHGETIAEPVITGTNRCAIEAGCDILAHPGKIIEDDVKLAVKNGTCLEITTRLGHSPTNRHVITLAKRLGAKMILDNDAHSPNDLISAESAREFLTALGLNSYDIDQIFRNSEDIVTRIKRAS